MDITVRIELNKATLTLTGDSMSAQDMSLLDETVDDLLKKGIRDVTVCLDRLKRLDSAGLGLFVRLFAAVSRAGGHIRLAGVDKRLTELFKVTGLFSEGSVGDSRLREGQAGPEQQYVLGSHAEELARLDHQAALIERPTRLLLQAAGITHGMRVLDLGTGLGHVARIAGELVGPEGSVLGIDRSGEVLALARERARQAGMTHVTFDEADASTWRASEPFDAIVGRLLLFHVPNPSAVVQHHAQNLRPGGLFVAIDFDLGSSRAEPPVPLMGEVLRWVEEAFRAAGAWPRIGARLGAILEDGGLGRISTFGIQAYLSSHDPSAAALLAGVARSLAPAIIRHGIATADQLDAVTLEERIAEAIRQADAVMLPPTVVGAWGHSPDEPSTATMRSAPPRRGAKALS